MLIGISDQMGARFDRLRCEVFQNLILSPMNTGLLRAAIATAPTVYGIETKNDSSIFWHIDYIATAPTVYGIETGKFYLLRFQYQILQQHLPFTVLKRRTYSLFYFFCPLLQQHLPFTVLKPVPYCFIYWKIFLLQQLLPFTVLKPTICGPEISIGWRLQQCLPFMVCAEGGETAEEQSDDEVRTSQVPERSEGKTKVIGQQCLPFTVLKRHTISRTEPLMVMGCNSSYRLRYWNLTKK